MDKTKDAVEKAVAEYTSLIYIPSGEGVSGSNTLGGIISALSLLHFVVPTFVDEAFALIPHHTVFTPVPVIPVPFFWNLLTAHFFEGNLVKAVLIAPWVIALSRMLERLWSSKSLAIHLLFSALASGAGSFSYELFCAYRSHSHYAFFAPVRGCVGLVVALAVGLRHAYPFEALPLVPHSWGLQCQHLAFGLTAFITTVGLIFPQWLPEWPFAPLALWFGWFHIRYIMWFPYAEAHGDHSPEFTFDSLLPRPIRPLGSFVGGIVYRIGTSCCSGFVKLREANETLGHAIVYDPSKAAETSETNGSTKGVHGVGLRLPGPSKNASVATSASQKEYDDRRTKALQLLDDNINALLAGQGGGGPKAAVDLEPGVELATVDDADV